MPIQLFFFNLSGTAANGGDYPFSSSSVSLQPGDSVYVIELPITDDTEVEGDETIVLTLTGEQGLNPISLGNSLTDTVFIRDDDDCLTGGGNVIHVDHNGDDSDGSSWSTAYRDLQTAIDAALSCSQPGNVPQIWVASGTYIPTTDTSGNSHPLDVRTKTFFING